MFSSKNYFTFSLLSAFLFDAKIFLAHNLIEIDFQFRRIMRTNTALKLLPVFGEDKKIDVSIENDEAIIKLSTWTENLGWNCQKTMRLDVEMIDDLNRALAAARYRLNVGKIESETENCAGKIIQFPAVA